MAKNLASMSKQSLIIGVSNPQFELTQLLNSIGVLYKEVDFSTLTLNNYSALILGSETNLSTAQKKSITEYISAGGSLLEINKSPVFYPSKNVRLKNKRFVVNSSSDPDFSGISHIDLFDQCGLSRSTNAIFEGLVDFNPYQKGYIAFVGINLESLFKLKKHKRKRFYSSHGIYPDEIVSQVSIGDIQKLVKNVLLKLHLKRNLPLITKWHSPTFKPVFTYRIDTDFGTKKSLDNLYYLADKYNLKLTWFLHTKAHEGWINHLKSYKKQEFALHCYKHGTTRSLNKFSADYNEANTLLIKNNIDTKGGYAAPYGIWNKVHNRFFCKHTIKYSSDFSCGYDALPFNIKLDNNKQLLQIAIHPICTGSLSRKRYTVDSMIDYFSEVMQNAHSQFLPIMLYHHPLQPSLKVIEYIFKKIHELEYENMTYSEFADFWKKRESTTFNIELLGDELIIPKSAENSTILEINYSANKFSLAKTENGIKLGALDKIDRLTTTTIAPSDVNVLYSNKIELLKTSMLDWKNRIKL